jgi:pyruvate dehydrogenase E2 component (dihydrolipoamide acetyltransferase)
MGRVIERDVLRGASRNRGPGITVQEPQPAHTLNGEAGFPTAPHFYLSAEARADALLGLRERLLAAVERQTGVRLTVTDLLVRIVAAALVGHPRANAFWDATEGRIRLHKEINVGVAVTTEDGQMAPVLRGANRMGMAQIAAERNRLMERATNGKLPPQDLDGGTFTLTNLGMYRVDILQARLGPRQAATLTVGRIVERPVAIQGELNVRPTMVLTLSCDQRVLDDIAAARFLDRVVELIEEPALLMT